MSLPQAFLDAIQQENLRATYVLSINGLDVAYSDGVFTGDPGDDADIFFGSDNTGAGRAPQRLVPWLKLDEHLNADGRELAGTSVDHREGRADMGEMRIAISDVDGSLRGLWATRRDDIQATLGADIGRTDSSITLAEDMSALWDDNAVAFIGRETVKIIGAATDAPLIARGVYGSLAAPHPRGAVVSIYPRFLFGRKVKLQLCYGDPTAGAIVTVFIGYIRTNGWDDLGATLVLQCEDAQTRLKRPLFKRLGERFNKGSVPFHVHDTRSNDGHIVSGVSPVAPANAVLLGPIDPDDWPNGTILTAVSAQSIPSFTRLIGGLIFDTTDDKGDVYGHFVWLPGNNHSTYYPSDHNGDSEYYVLKGQRLSELIVIGAGQGAFGLFFDPMFPDQDASPILGSHPLALLLQLLISTGAGFDGDTPTCVYDTLPADQGLAIPPAEVDIQRFEYEIRRTSQMSGWRINVPVTETITDFREFAIKELLKPFGFHLVINSAGQLSVRSLRDLDADEKQNLPQITIDDLVLVQDGPQHGGYDRFEGPTIDGDQVTVAVKWTSGWVIRDGKISMAAPVTVNLLPDPELSDAAEQGDALEVETTGVGFSDPVSTSGLADATLAFRSLRTQLATRFAWSPAKITGRFRLEMFPLSPGDIVRGVFPILPSNRNPDTGLDNVLMEVTGRTFDPERHVVELELAESGLGLANTRLIAPTARIDSVAVVGLVTVLTCAANVYSASGGSRHDAGFFVVGEKVVVELDDTVTRSSVATITVVNGNDVTIDIILGGDYLTHAKTLRLAPYADADATARARYAFMANNVEVLGSADDPVYWQVD